MQATKRFVLAAALACGWGAAHADAESRSASLAVSVTVIRACTIGANTTPGTMTIACSKGVTRVLTDASATPRILSDGPNTIPAGASQNPPLVTLNF